MISRRSILIGAAFGAVAPTTGPRRLAAQSASAKPPTTFYVSGSRGINNSYAGTSPDAPWRTASFVNDRLAAGQVTGGDTVLFLAGDTFEGGLRPSEQPRGVGDPITFGAYGSGAQPVFESYKDPIMWTRTGASTWSVDLGPTSHAYRGTRSAEANVGFLLVDGEPFGARRTALEQLTAQWDFCVVGTHLVVFSEQDPAVMASGIRCAVFDILFRGASSVRVSDLAFVGSGGHGYQQRGPVEDVVVERCTFDLLGGAMDSSKIRYGNGIEVFAGGADAEFRDNRIRRTYDVATTIQGTTDAARSGWRNIAFTGNDIEQCTQSFEYWGDGSGPGASNVTFTRNSCRAVGAGWGARDRPDKHNKRCHILLAEPSTLPIDITLTDNVFDGADSDCYINVRGAAIPAGFTSTRNTISLQKAHQQIQADSRIAVEWAHVWVEQTGLERESTFVVL